FSDRPGGRRPELGGAVAATCVGGDAALVGRMGGWSRPVVAEGLVERVGTAADRGAAVGRRRQHRRHPVPLCRRQRAQARGVIVIGLCTDSNAQLPAELVDRYGVEVVPLTVTLDGDDFLEGVNLDADGFYARFEQGVTQVSTAAPSPGRFMLAYEALVERGATEILSIHIGSSVSSTLDAARVASRGAGVPVRLVDTGTASFGVACCVWEAAEALAKGAGVEEAASVADAVAARTGNVFVVGALELARRGGRLGGSPSAPGPAAIPVLTLADGRMVPVGEVPTM